MKRSEINQLIHHAIEFFSEKQFFLPSFAFWSPEQWAAKGHDYDQIRENCLGWDVTDFAGGRFYEQGLLLFTLRNGNPKKQGDKPYAEKVMITREGQITPYHFHTYKMEDIINRGGGLLNIQVFNSAADFSFAKTPVILSVDGCRMSLEAGSVLTLHPGDSITLPPFVYHQFWGEKGHGDLLLGEVSMVNDDTTDNHFYEPIGRFSQIEEDEPANYLLANEYPI